jgi:hypothetical protein
MGITSVPKSSTCASRSEDSVRRSSSFSAPAYRLHRLSCCSGECLRRSKTFAPSGTGSGRRRAVPRKARAWRPELVMREQLKWYDEKADNSPWINALAEVRQRATREGYCYQHVQAITVAIDQYAEKALGNRDYFLNKPYGAG